MRGTARLGSTAHIERAHSYRARSASKEGTWPLPHPLSPQAADKIECGWRQSGNPVALAFLVLLRDGPIGLRLRASNEGLLRPRVARAKETNGLPLFPTPSNTASPAPLSTQYFFPPPLPPLWPSLHISPPGEQQSGAPARPTKWRTGAVV